MPGEAAGIQNTEHLLEGVPGLAALTSLYLHSELKHGAHRKETSSVDWFHHLLQWVGFLETGGLQNVCQIQPVPLILGLLASECEQRLMN